MSSFDSIAGRVVLLCLPVINQGIRSGHGGFSALISRRRFGDGQRRGGSTGQRIVGIAALYPNGISTRSRGCDMGIGVVLGAGRLVAIHQSQPLRKCVVIASGGIDGLGSSIVGFGFFGHGNSNNFVETSTSKVWNGQDFPLFVTETEMVEVPTF